MLPPHQYYKSEKILGILYRNVDEKHIWTEDIQRVVTRAGPSVWDQFVGLIERKIYDYTGGRVTRRTRQAEAKRLRDVYAPRSNFPHSLLTESPKIRRYRYTGYEHVLGQSRETND